MTTDDNTKDRRQRTAGVTVANGRSVEVRGYTHIATVRDLPGVPVRRDEDGRYWWSAYQVRLALVHAPRDVRDLVPLDDVEPSGSTDAE
jgi:hypothetical protein